MATYYVDKTTGSDSDSGLTEELAWETVNKVNISSFNADDFILFKRGETWAEKLEPPSDGSSGSPITFGAYGTGADPIIDGEDTRDGIFVDGRDYNTIRDLEIIDCNGYGVNNWASDNMILDNLTISGSTTTAVISYGNNCEIRNCELSDSTNQHGIYLAGSVSISGIIIEHNYIYNCGDTCIQLNLDTGNITNTVIRYNWLEAADLMEVNDLAGDGVEYYYNIFVKGSGSSFNAIHIAGDAANLEIYNNTFYGDWNDGIIAAVDAATTGHDIRNNIIYETNASYKLIYFDTGSTGTFDNNQYYRPTNYTGAWNYNGTNYDSLAAWRTALGGCPGAGNDCDAAIGDPLFTSITNDDFRLQFLSPCRNAGTNVSLTEDYIGTPVPQDTTQDIGAYEFLDWKYTMSGRHRGS